LTLYYIKPNVRQRIRERRRIGRRHCGCILTPQSLAWIWRYWVSLQWKVGAMHSHKFTHVRHTLLIRSRTLCIRYSYARVRYAYVTHTLAYVMHTLLIRSHTLCIRYSYARIRYAYVSHTLLWWTVVDSSG